MQYEKVQHPRLVISCYFSRATKNNKKMLNYQKGNEKNRQQVAGFVNAWYTA